VEHVLSDDRAVENVHGGEQCRRAIAHVVVGPGSGAAFLDWQRRLRLVKLLDPVFPVETEHDGVRRRVDVEPDDVAQFADELRVFESLSCRTQCGWNPWSRWMRWIEDTLTPTDFAIAALVQCVVSPGGGSIVSSTTRSATEGASFGMHEGRVFSRNRGSPP